MQTHSSAAALRTALAAERQRGREIALVPTMGNLHEGHLAVVRAAQSHAQCVVVSSFVNPKQFGPGEDFERYPRSPERDHELLTAQGVGHLFTPATEELYPAGEAAHTAVLVPGLSDILCGAKRPGHFSGVATVVCKLLNIAAPRWALFGEKDYQQLAVLRRMAAELCLPTAIVGVPTVRAPDGLALSSRNQYLSPAERRRASALCQSLGHTAEALRGGARDFAALCREGERHLQAAGMAPEYYEVRVIDTLAVATADSRNMVVLGAAQLGRARLIDNLSVAVEG